MFMKPEQCLFGCAYYDEYMPVSRIDTDFKMMKDANMNVIRIAESTWSTWEPEEGVFNFRSLIQMLEGARKYGLRVIIGTPTYAFPSWLLKIDPDVLATTKTGKLLYGRRQLIDIINPTYRKYAERVTRKLLEACNPYHDVIIGYQLDNETRSAGSMGEVAQKIFVERMKEKFNGDISAFNQEFGLDYWSNRIPSWEDFPDVRGTINGSLDAEYRAFLRDAITEFLGFLKDIIDDYKMPGEFITHNFDFSWIGHSFGLQPEVNQKDAARCMDIAGVDIYHPSKEDLTGLEIAMGGAVGRSLKKDNYLVLETQAQGRPSWTPYPGQLTLQALSHLASGAGSVMYWHWHSIHNSYETYWKGILSHDLQPNEPYVELSELGILLSSVGDRITFLKKAPSVAIMLDNRSLTGIDEFPSNGEEAFHGLPEDDYNHMMRLWFDSCMKLNVEADFVYCDDDLSSYALVIVPALYSASDITIARLRAFAENGGHLIITPRCFFSDEHLKVYADAQPHGFTDLTGCTYNEFSTPLSIGFKGTLPLTGTAHSFMEYLIPSTAEVLSSYDHMYLGRFAAVARLGNVTTVGCILDEHDTMAVLENTLAASGIDVPEAKFPVSIKTGMNKYNEKITFIFNYSMEAVDHQITESYKDLLTEDSLSPGQTISLPPWGYRIFCAMPV